MTDQNNRPTNKPAYKPALPVIILLLALVGTNVAVMNGAVEGLAFEILRLVLAVVTAAAALWDWKRQSRD